MVYRTTTTLGPQVDEVFPTTGPYWDNQLAIISINGVDIQPSYETGTIVRGSDGGEYLFVEASGTITATNTTGTQVALTKVGDNYTAVGGSDGWYTPPAKALAAGEFVHVRRGAWDANPA